MIAGIVVTKLSVFPMKICFTKSKCNKNVGTHYIIKHDLFCTKNIKYEMLPICWVGQYTVKSYNKPTWVSEK